MATVISNQSIDPVKGAKFPITVSEQLLREDRPKKRQRVSVQCNRRPKVSGSSRSTIKPSKNDNSYELAIHSDEKGEYKYNGVQHPPSSPVALFYDPVEKSFTLDKLDADFRFTLSSTPGQKDVSDAYPQLENGAGDEDHDGEDLFGGESDDGEIAADPNNPYDYRHFLNKGNQSTSPMPSRAASPVPQHTFNSSPALPATSPQARKATAPASRRPRPKQRDHEKPRYLSPKPRPEEAEADNEDSHPNELVIDMGDSAPITNSRPWRSALNVLNEGGRSSAPISLRSAASSMSPSLRGGSPSDNEKDVRAAVDGNEEEEEEDDDDEGEEQQAGEEEQSDADAHADADNDDVEEMDLRDDKVDSASAPPPPQPEEAVTPGNGWDDDDDDELEAELALALEEDQAKSDIEDAARGGAVDVAGGESSEESEEE